MVKVIETETFYTHYLHKETNTNSYTVKRGFYKRIVLSNNTVMWLDFDNKEMDYVQTEMLETEYKTNFKK